MLTSLHTRLLLLSPTQLAQVLAGLNHFSDAKVSTLHHVTISTEIISRS